MNMRLATGMAAILFACSARAASPADTLKSIPLRFEQDHQGHWISRGAGFSFRFDPGATLMRLGGRAIRLSFDGASTHLNYRGSGSKAAPTNYFVGREYRSAAAFSQLRSDAVYPGIDMVYYGNGRQLEYDFELAPGADPSAIHMRFEGADGVGVNNSGDIVLQLGLGEVLQKPPVVYQRRSADDVVAVEARYRLLADGAIGIALGDYNRAGALVIDPAIVYAAYLGGTYGDAAVAMAHDSQGFLYLGGYTFSPDFPAGGDVFQPIQKVGTRDAWVMKFNPSAQDPSSVIVYATFFGGILDDDLTSMTVDANGVIYFTGTTLSPDLPLSPGAYQTSLGNTSALLNGYVAAIDPSVTGAGALVYSSLFGASQIVNPTGVATAGGKIYICGWTNSDNLPIAGLTTQSTRAGGYDGFVAGFDPTQTGAASLMFSTYLGGTQQDVARSLAVDSSGKVYVAGSTLSPDFFTTANGFQPNYSNGGGDGFLTQLDPNSGTIVYSTYLGGTGLDVVTKLFLEPSGRIALTGYTFSPDFPRTANAAQPAYGGNQNSDAFIMVLDVSAPNRSSALVYSTYYGGSDGEVGYDIRRDPAGLYYICGYTLSKNLPVSADAMSPVSAGGGLDGFIAVIDPSRALVYASYITGPAYQIAYAVDYDTAGNVYVTGLASGNIFPASAPPHNNGTANYDGYLLGLAMSPSARQSAAQGEHVPLRIAPNAAKHHPLRGR